MTATGARSPAADGPSPELVARFTEALNRLWPEGGKLGLAVSGGPDSMAMLLLAHAAIPGEFEVATVDHGLRPEAQDECALVLATCEARGIPCEVLTVDVGEGNVQAKAREARYQALDDWAVGRLDAIATAHHADDQAETLIMRLNRGSGLQGLAGVWEIGDTDLWNVPVIRPLLRFRRLELFQVIAASGITVAHDPSNEDESFERVRIRKLLKEADWLDPVAWAQSASHLAEAHDALQAAALSASFQYVSASEGEVRLRVRGPRELDRILATRCLQRLGGEARGKDIAALVNRLYLGMGGNVGGVLVTVEQGGTEPVWVFRREPPRRSG
jgi:tRNA(Ile)-lysidine synthase